jgi:hypothetical protein
MVMKTGSRLWWVRVVLVSLGLFGAAFALTGLLVGLPRPAAGGTCGPGRGSEAAVVAFFDPVTIGAGPEPSASNAAAHADWVAFVQECQTAADDRAAAAIPILVISVGLVAIGLVLGRRSRPAEKGPPTYAAASWAPPPRPRHPLDPPEIPFLG